jgi:hypothetical protein
LFGGGTAVCGFGVSGVHGKAWQRERILIRATPDRLVVSVLAFLSVKVVLVVPVCSEEGSSDSVHCERGRGPRGRHELLRCGSQHGWRGHHA